MDTIGARPQRMPWQLVMTFLFFTLSVILTGYLYFRQHTREVRSFNHADLETVARFKVKQILDWRSERLADGWAIALSPIFGEAVDRWIGEQTNQALRDDIYDRINAYNKYNDYQRIFLASNSGRILIPTDQKELLLGFNTKELIRKTRREKEVLLSDFYFCEPCQTVHLDVVAPVMKHLPKGEKVVAVLVMRIDPYHFLYPIIQSWPAPSKSAETYLIRKDGNQALFLNELRHRKNTAMKFKIPLKGDSPSSLAAMGSEGVMEGTDYDGEKVLASIMKIPGSSWVLVAKISTKEAFAQLYREAWTTSIIVGILILIIGLAITFLWYRQQKDFYQKQYVIEREKQLLNQRYQLLTKHANDMIFLADDDLNILDANERAVFVYGYSMNELLKMRVGDLRTEEKRKSIEKDFKKVRDENGAVYETVHKKKDNSTFPVEASARMIDIEGQKYFQDIIRDVSERKRAEQSLLEMNQKLLLANQRLMAADEELRASDEELRTQLAKLQESREELWKSEQKYRSIFENTGTASLIIEEDNTISLANDEFEKLSGYSRGEIEGKMKWTEFVCKPDLERMREYHHRRRQDPNSAPRRYEFHFIDRIGMIKDIFLTIDMMLGTGKSVASLLDITKRKAAEQQIKASLREKEVLLREIYHRVKNNLQVVSSLLNLQSGYVQDPRDKEIFVESQNRIRSMSLVHENLYKSPDLTRIDFGHYVQNLISDLIRSYGILSDQLAVTLDINDITMGVDLAIPCGLMINEMVSNSLKHAFKKPPAAGKKWELTVRLKLERDVLYHLEVADNGTGFADKSDQLSAPATLGLQLITILAEQLDGKVTMHQKNGTRYVVEFRKVT